MHAGRLTKISEKRKIIKKMGGDTNDEDKTNNRENLKLKSTK